MKKATLNTNIAVLRICIASFIAVILGLVLLIRFSGGQHTTNPVTPKPDVSQATVEAASAVKYVQSFIII